VSGELLRVFDIGRVEGDLEVDLDARRARRHGDVFIGFVKHGRYLGTHAYVVGDEGRVILTFPWVDKVNWLLAFGATDELPVAIGDQGWDDLEQGWWASAIVRGDDVYLAETDFDRIVDEVRDADRIEYLEPGTVLVDGVEVSWHVVGRQAYDAAWRRAIRSCRRFKPSPVGRVDSGVFSVSRRGRG
jgi:hypothetical protein